MNSERKRKGNRLYRSGCKMLIVGLLLLTVGLPLAHAEELTEDEKKLLEIYRNITDYHVSDTSEEEVLDGAVEGMLETLDDPHSTYYEPEEYRQFLDSLERTFTGIGIYVETKDGNVVVQSPIEGSPAEKAGVRSGDRIVEVDGENVEGLSLEMVASKIKGEAGTTVQLTVEREGESQPLHFQIERQQIQLPIVESEMLEDGIGYIRLYSFSQDADVEFERHLKKLQDAGMQKLIFDLRGNPGGLLDTALSISENFIQEGALVHVVNSNGQKSSYQAEGKHWDLPTVVLINGGSASASEVVTGALNDYHKAVIIGTKSFGKGTVQTMFPLESGGVLKLTIQEYFTPMNHKINGVGIQPDIVVTDPEKQLQAAVDFLRQEDVLTLTSEQRVMWEGTAPASDQRIAVFETGSWYVSLRQLAFLFDGDVRWEGETKTIHFTMGDEEKSYTLGAEKDLKIFHNSAFLSLKTIEDSHRSLETEHMNGDWYIWKQK